MVENNLTLWSCIVTGRSGSFFLSCELFDSRLRFLMVPTRSTAATATAALPIAIPVMKINDYL